MLFLHLRFLIAITMVEPSVIAPPTTDWPLGSNSAPAKKWGPGALDDRRVPYRRSVPPLADGPQAPQRSTSGCGSLNIAGGRVPPGAFDRFWEPRELSIRALLRRVRGRMSPRAGSGRSTGAPTTGVAGPAYGYRLCEADRPSSDSTRRTSSVWREMPCVRKICFRCQRTVPSVRPVAAAISRNVRPSASMAATRL